MMYDYFIGPNGVFDTPLTAFLFSATLFVYMWMESRYKIRAPQNAVRERKKTFMPLAVAIPISLLSPLLCGFLKLGVIRGDGRTAAIVLGFIFFIGGRLLRLWAQLQMGRLYIGEAAVQQGHRVVQSGPYRWIRHPGYTGGTLSAIGIGLALSTWLGAFIAGAVLIAAYIMRIPLEEALLVRELGDDYRSYMTRTKRFVPFVV